MFLKIPQNSQVFFSEFCEIFKNTCFYRPCLGDCSYISARLRSWPWKKTLVVLFVNLAFRVLLKMLTVTFFIPINSLEQPSAHKNSHTEMFYKKNLQISQENSWSNCFPMNSAKFLRKPFLQNISSRNLAPIKPSKKPKYHKNVSFPLFMFW